MDSAELDYPLPTSAVAQQPVEPRDAARLLVARRGRPPEHRRVADLPDLLDPSDVVVVNDSRVIPARLQLRKPTGGEVEVLLLAPSEAGGWEALVRPSRRVAPGTRLVPAEGSPGPAFEVEVGDASAEGARLVVLHHDAADDLALLAAVGDVPLPPYIHEPLADPARYQTVFAERPGSVAAPTAGLHLTASVLARLDERGIPVRRVDLAVGLGTFRPMTAARVEDHPMHAERYVVPPATVAALDPRPAGDVVAVGTTVVRALETWAATGAATGATDLFIHGRYPFAVVDRLLTNFHVPRSSLLALVEAFVGPGWRELYATALAEGYRFLSFGDALLLDRRTEDPT